MSRHNLRLSGNRTLTVGWDPPLQTYYGVLHAPGRDNPLLRVGQEMHELFDLDDLARALGPHAVHLTPQLGLQLDSDRKANHA